MARTKIWRMYPGEDLQPEGGESDSTLLDTGETAVRSFVFDETGVRSFVFNETTVRMNT